MIYPDSLRRWPASHPVVNGGSELGSYGYSPIQWGAKELFGFSKPWFDRQLVVFGIDGCCDVCATGICYIMGFAILESSQFYMETMVKSVSSCSK